MTIPEHALRMGSSRPFSGGERMTRERRGLIGSSDSANPLILIGPMIVDAIGVQVIVEVSVGIIAAIATLVMPKKLPPKDECADQYTECMDTPLANIVVDVHGTSLCATCRKICQKKEAWPSVVMGFKGWQSCNY